MLGCCVLHNLCIAEGDLWEQVEYLEDEVMPTAEEDGTERNEDVESDVLTEVVLKHLGEVKRNTIADAF